MQMPPRTMLTRPRKAELDQLANEALVSAKYHTLASSPWTGSGLKHRFTLVQFEHHVRHRDPARRLIFVNFYQYQNQKLHHLLYSENQSPLVYNCPMPILNTANECPAQTLEAQAWREKSRQHVEELAGIKILLKNLKEQHPHGDMRLVIKEPVLDIDPDRREINVLIVKNQVIFDPQTHGGRTTNWCNSPNANGDFWTRLRPDMIDLEDTMLLRASPHAPDKHHKEQPECN